MRDFLGIRRNLDMRTLCLAVLLYAVNGETVFNNGHTKDNDIIDLDGDLWEVNQSSNEGTVSPSSYTIIEQEAPGGGDYDPSSDNEDDSDSFSGSGSGEMDIPSGNISINVTDISTNDDLKENTVVDDISNIIEQFPQTGVVVSPDEISEEIHLDEETNRIEADWPVERLLQRKKQKTHCQFSLFDTKHKKFVHENWNYTKLLVKGDAVVWCKNNDRFILFNTPQKICRSKADLFCRGKGSPDNAPRRKKRKNKGDYGNRCWSKFSFGGTMPRGFLDDNGNLYYMCQRFSPHGNFGKVFPGSETYFGTILDTERRLPLMAMAKVTELGDTTWPAVPDMVEYSLIKQDKNPWLFNWFAVQKKKGMIVPSEVTDCDEEDECKFAEYQPIINDYVHSHYKKAYLIWPTLAGRRADQRIATLTMTNTALMHPALLPLWQSVIVGVRRYAGQRCGIPTQGIKFEGKSYKSRSALYVIAGTVPSRNGTRILWNEVNIPDIFWMTVCCVKNTKIESFGIYARNGPNSPIISSSVAELQEMLADSFKVNRTGTPLELYPAQAGVCGDVNYDISGTIL